MSETGSRHKQEAHLFDQEALSSSLNQVNELILMADWNGIVFYVNDAYEACTGYSQEEICQKKISLISSGHHDKHFYHDLWHTITRGHPFTNCFINKRKDGSLFYEEKTITPIYDQKNEIAHFISIGKEIPSKEHYQQRLSQYIYKDPMTGLANRLSFMQELEHNVLRASRNHGAHFALFFIDLDHFKSINDTLGHQAGDHILIATAKRLSAAIREADVCARMGGDEFAIIMVDAGEISHLATMARKLIEKLSQPIDYKENSLHVSCSIGISVFPRDSKNLVTLLSQADDAMYRSKKLGAGNFSFADKSQMHDDQRLQILKRDILSAEYKEQLTLFYQPQINLNNTNIERYEALLRWQHPQLGCIEPEELLPIIESSGLMCEIGHWVISQAYQQIQQWQQDYQQNINIAVNLSGHQLIQRNFVESIAVIIQNEGAQYASNLILEINENLLIGDIVQTMDKFRGLEKIGVNVSIDDYRSGQISLSDLNKSNIKTLKIDRKFIQNIPHDDEATAIVDSIIAIAHALNMKVTAVGIEHQEQYDYLKNQDCDLGQGYFFYPPMHSVDIQNVFIINSGGNTRSL